jgi:hypothetical protein
MHQNSLNRGISKENESEIEKRKEEKSPALQGLMK